MTSLLCIYKKNIYNMKTPYADALSKICRDYHSRIERLEEEKYDLEYIVKGKDFQVHTDTLHYTFKRKQKTSNDKKKYLTPLKMLYLIYFTIFLNLILFYFHSTLIKKTFFNFFWTKLLKPKTIKTGKYSSSGQMTSKFF